MGGSPLSVHTSAVVITLCLLAGLVALPFIDSLADPPLDGAPFSDGDPGDAATDDDLPDDRATDDEVSPADAMGESDGIGIEGPSNDTPDRPAATADWGRETEPFDGGSARTVRAFAITEEEIRPDGTLRAFDGNPTKLYDLDGDGVQEILAQNDDHGVYVFDGRTGALRAELRSELPSHWEARSFNGPEAAVLEPNGVPHVVTANSAAVVTAYAVVANGTSGGALELDEAWSVRLDACHEDPGMDAKVTLADLDLDGDLEILAATEEQGLYALDHDGSLAWKNCMSGGNAAPVVAEVTADGWPDVVHVSDGGVVSLLSGQDGAWIWTYELLDEYELGSGSIPVRPAVGDLDGRPGLEIVVGARDSHDTADWDEDHALLLALDAKGNVTWDFQDPNGNPLTYTRPIITDADGDGANEVYWADWNTVGHNPPSEKSPMVWNRTGPANLYRLDAEGEVVWNRTLETWWNNKDLAIADMDGDGDQEVLANGPNRNGTDGIWYLDAATGEKKGWVSLGPWKAQRGPVVGDLWGTGTAQWVIQAAPVTAEEGPAILVYDAQVPYDAAWPHLPDPVVDAPFAITDWEVDGNAHWVAVKAVQSGDRIKTMEMRGPSGTWTAMADEGWGWALDATIPDGTEVRFRATGERGDVVHSGCYEWPAVRPVDCAVPGTVRT